MKKLFLTVLFLLITINLQPVAATTATPSPKEENPTPSASVIDKLKKIEILKEKIATKVAEIRENEKKGAGGTIKTLTNSSFILSTKNKEDLNISFSEDTVFYTSTESGKSAISNRKLKEGDSVTVFGYFDAPKQLLSAKYIYYNKASERKTGKIANIDKENYNITLKFQQEEVIVDIETYSKIYTVSNSKLSKSGFSKLKVGDLIYVFGSPNPKEENRISALRFFHLAQLPVLSPALKADNKNSTPSASPSD